MNCHSIKTGLGAARIHGGVTVSMADVWEDLSYKILPMPDSGCIHFETCFQLKFISLSYGDLV